ncbi:MAG: CTP synthetase [Rhodobacteraceae bacterium]|nr:CTP synthetase [Paracoccaceae bacterium]
MFRLASVIYAVASVTMAGIFVVAALATGNDTLVPILVAAGLGFVLAAPASWLIARQINT